MILHITADKGFESQAQQIGIAIRNSQVGQAKGGLLVKEPTDADPRYLLEKIIVAKPLYDDGAGLQPLQANAPATGAKLFAKASDVPWKKEAMVILVGETISLLDTFEELLPGFVKQLGPVTKLHVGK